MEDLRSTRPERSSGIERYSSREKQSSDKTADKKFVLPGRKSKSDPSVPEIGEIGDAQDHQLDERA